MHMDLDKIGQHICLARKSRKLSQASLGQQLGMSRATISGIENGTVPEIGIRKVMGATVAGITGLLARDFLKLVLVALVLAAPVAWFFMDRWLSDFAYRISMPWWVFVLSGVAAVIIAFATVSFQSVRAALANPVESLRSE